MESDTGAEALMHCLGEHTAIHPMQLQLDMHNTVQKHTCTKFLKCAGLKKDAKCAGLWSEH